MKTQSELYADRIKDEAAKEVQEHFRNGEHHEKVFSCNIGKERESLLEIAVNAMQRQFEASGFIARLAEYAAVNGESMAAKKVANQMKAMILESLIKTTESEVEKSARKWAEKNNAGEVNYTTFQLIKFINRCDKRGKEIWLSRGWAKVWERIEEILADEEDAQESFPCKECGRAGMAAADCLCPICGGE